MKSQSKFKPLWSQNLEPKLPLSLPNDNIKHEQFAREVTGKNHDILIFAMFRRFFFCEMEV